MAVIRVSDRNYERIKGWAEPLVDTADSALDRILDAAERDRGRQPAEPPDRGAAPRPAPTETTGRRTRTGGVPQKEFRRPLLEALYERGSQGRTQDLQAALEKRMKRRLSRRDNEILPSTGERRWWNAVCWERSVLKNEGYIRSDSPRGVWALTDKGAAQVESWLAESGESFVDHLLAMPDTGENDDFDPRRSAGRRIDI